MSDRRTPFGNYVLLERLARGGMAEVFLAQQKGPEGFDRRVALKRILPHLMDSDAFVRMFHDEAKLAARLSHPNVVHIYEFGKADDHHFIAMEFVDGVHTGQLIEYGATEPIPPALVARIGADACAGLNHAHRLEDNEGNPLHLVHRDISPPNLMISREGVVKVVDFGIAKAVDMAGKTRPGIVKGKFAYMSPEQTMGKKLDGRSDIFSLGIVIWEILAGRVALDRTDPVEAMKCIRDGRLPSIRKARPDVPDGLARVIEMALTVKPAERPTAAELGNAFEAFIKASPDLATSMQLSEWIRARFKRAKSVKPRDTIATPVPQMATPAPGAAEDARAASLAFARDAAGQHEEMAHIGARPPVQLPHPPLSSPAPVLPSGFGPAPGAPGAAGPPDMSLGAVMQTPRPVPGAAPMPAGHRPMSAHTGADPRRRRHIIIGVVVAAVLGLLLILSLSGDDPSASSASSAASDAGIGDLDGAAEAAEAADGGASDDGKDGGVEPSDAGAEPWPVPGDGGPEDDTAWVVIKTEPEGAEVRIDRGEVQTSPALFDGLALGRHRVTISLSGYKTLKKTLTLEPGMSELEYTLERSKRRKRKGKLNLFTRPSCTAYIGKKKLGTTPFAGKKLDPGSYTVTCKKSGYRTGKTRVRIRSGKTTKGKIKLKKK